MKVLHVRKDGHYHHVAKIAVNFAIELGDPHLAPHVRGSVLDIGSAVYAPLEPQPIYFVTSATTSAGILRRTISPALTQINLAVHHSRYVHNTVANRVGPSNFSIVPRPPYHPKYGPIE